jgi:hypothetical protein
MKEKLAMPCTGQQWEQDINNGGEPENFNSWIEKQALTEVKSESAEEDVQRAIIKEAEIRYPVDTHINPLDSPYVIHNRTFKLGAKWMHDFANNSEAMKENAIGFAKWVSDNGWKYVADEYWLSGYIEQKMTDELYNIYLTNKEK